MCIYALYYLYYFIKLLPNLRVIEVAMSVNHGSL